MRNKKQTLAAYTYGYLVKIDRRQKSEMYTHAALVKCTKPANLHPPQRPPPPSTS